MEETKIRCFEKLIKFVQACVTAMEDSEEDTEEEKEDTEKERTEKERVEEERKKKEVVVQVSSRTQIGVMEETKIGCFEKLIKFVPDCVTAMEESEENREKGKEESQKECKKKMRIEEERRKKEERKKKKRKIEEELEFEWTTFQELLKTDEICLESIQTWMEKAHSSCLFLANTLSSAREVVDCLNSIISGLLIGATFIMWLLLTKLATTKVLVLIVSPLLAATFIFGDTCKTLFQGIIFVYVLHPFDVGDLCVIDEKMVEVKAIGVWKTTFCRVEKDGAKEKVIYPNSELANKVVINHKTDFDWDDNLEFNVGFMDKEKMNELEQLIENHISNGRDDYTPSSYNVMALVNESGVKIVVHVKYKVHYIQDGTYFECLQQKEKLRSDFYIDIQNLINKFKANVESETSG